MLIQLYKVDRTISVAENEIVYCFLVVQCGAKMNTCGLFGIGII